MYAVAMAVLHGVIAVGFSIITRWGFARLVNLGQGPGQTP